MDYIEDDCVICLETLNNYTNKSNKSIRLLPCSHKMHNICINKLISSQCLSRYKCPICRQSFNSPYNGILGISIIIFNISIILFYATFLRVILYSVLNSNSAISQII